MPRRRTLTWLATLIGAAVVAGSLMASPAATAASGACPAETGVTVAIDFGPLGGGVQTACDPHGVGKTGNNIMESAGFKIDWVGGSGFVCRIKGAPSDLGCGVTPPANYYWALFRSDGSSGTWAYSTVGISGLKGKAGMWIGWRFQNTSDTVKPAVTPRGASAPATPTPTTKPSATASPKPTATASTTAASKPKATATATATKAPNTKAPNTKAPGTKAPGTKATAGQPAASPDAATANSPSSTPSSAGPTTGTSADVMSEPTATTPTSQVPDVATDSSPTSASGVPTQDVRATDELALTSAEPGRSPWVMSAAAVVILALLGSTFWWGQRRRARS